MNSFHWIFVLWAGITGCLGSSQDQKPLAPVWEPFRPALESGKVIEVDAEHLRVEYHQLPTNAVAFYEPYATIAGTLYGLPIRQHRTEIYFDVYTAGQDRELLLEGSEGDRKGVVRIDLKLYSSVNNSTNQLEPTPTSTKKEMLVNEGGTDGNSLCFHQKNSQVEHNLKLELGGDVSGSYFMYNFSEGMSFSVALVAGRKAAEEIVVTGEIGGGDYEAGLMSFRGTLGESEIRWKSDNGTIDVVLPQVDCP
jgi:hypothetical protein